MKATNESGNLVWGIKESFRDYLEMLPDTRISASDGASTTSDGLFAFPHEQAVIAEKETTLQFGGTVTIEAHGGELAVVVARPQVVLTVAGGRLRIPHLDIDVALLADVTWSTRVITAGCELSADGDGWLLPGYYEQGDLMDPITVNLPAGLAAHGDAGPAGAE